MHDPLLHLPTKLISKEHNIWREVDTEKKEEKVSQVGIEPLQE